MGDIVDSYSYEIRYVQLYSSSDEPRGIRKTRGIGFEVTATISFFVRLSWAYMWFLSGTERVTIADRGPDDTTQRTCLPQPDCFLQSTTYRRADAMRASQKFAREDTSGRMHIAVLV